MSEVNAQEDGTAVTRGQRSQRFDVFFQRHMAGIASYCRWRSCSLADAEDAVAEVFLIAWRRFDDLPAGESARPWLYATARRVLANQARASARRRRLNERLGAERIAIAVDDDPRIARAQDALATLDPHDRELLLLIEWEGLTPVEVAEVLRRPPVTVLVRLHRARHRLRAAYETQTSIELTRTGIPPLATRCEP